MLKLLKVILAVFVVCLSGYALVTGSFSIIPYAQLILGFMLLAMGINELQAKRKGYAIISFLTAAFVIFASIFSIKLIP